MEVLLALAILPVGVALLVSVLSGKPVRIEITHRVPDPAPIPEVPMDKTEQAVKETIAQKIQEAWMGVMQDDDRGTAG